MMPVAVYDGNEKLGNGVLVGAKIITFYAENGHRILEFEEPKEVTLHPQRGQEWSVTVRKSGISSLIIVM